MTTPSRNKVFVSYSHRDHEWLTLLQRFIKRHADEGLIEYWDDKRINAGDDWFEEIQKALSSARISILLVSQDFLNSDFINRIEVPQLLAETKVLWIPVRPSTYSRVEWLQKIQSSGDPNKPLSGLTPNDQELRMVEFIGDLDRALEGRKPDVPLPGPSRIPTKFEATRCDRTQILYEFTDLFVSGVRSRQMLPQVYVVHGREEECHDQLVVRLREEVIKPLAENEKAGSRKDALLFKDADVEWPVPQDDPEEHKELLQVHLWKTYTGMLPTDFPFSFPATKFASLAQHVNYRFVLVKHHLNLAEWASGNWRDSFRDLIDWYLNDYWGALAREMASQAHSSNRPQIIVFIKIEYPATSVSWLKRLFGSSKVNRHDVLSDLTNIISRADKLYPCHLLSELITPPPSRVVTWFAENGLCDTTDECRKKAEAIYKAHGEAISMWKIQEALAQYARG